MIQDYNYIVAVNCISYNHEPYILDALNGFTMQQTDFPYVCVIIDDASTDNEPEIIRNYLQEHFDLDDVSTVKREETEDYFLIYARHKTNNNCFFAVYWLKCNHYSRKIGKKKYYDKWYDQSKYIAMCEGDDYWIDPMKLQKQVDFLEKNQDYTMCFHNALEHFENNEHPDALFSNIKDKDYTGLDIIKKWVVPTASVLYRSSIDKSELKKNVVNNKVFIFGDTPLFLTCVQLGKIRGMSDVMSIYRRQGTSLTHIKDYNRYYKQAYHNLEIYKVFGKTYRRISKWNYAILMTSGFFKSIKDNKSTIRYYFIKESFQQTFFYSLLAIPRVFFEYVFKRKRI